MDEPRIIERLVSETETTERWERFVVLEGREATVLGWTVEKSTGEKFYD